MADNVPISAGAGTSIATDDVGGVHFQKGKLDAGGDGVSVPIVAGQQAAAASLPVVLASDGTLIPGTSASALGKAEDAAHTSGDVGVMALGVRKDTAAALAGADGDYQPAIYDSTGRLHVNTELPDAAALSDATANPTAPMVGAAAMGFDGTSWERARILFGNSDGIGVAIPDGASLATLTKGYLFNGTTWDRQRNNTEGTLLASAARTGSASSADQINYNARGVLLILNVTVASGTGGLQPYIYARDPVTGTASAVFSSAPTAQTATGTFLYQLYPGVSITASGGFIQLHSRALPRTWYVTVVHGDGSSYTYSLGYSYIL